MKHIPYSNYILFLAFLLISSTSFVSGQNSKDPWTAKQLVQPAYLAKMLHDEKSEKPLIFNIGTAANIKGAYYIGPTQEKEYVEKLKKELSKKSKNKEIIIYCGCCTLDHCPNIRPAFNTLRQMGFTNFKLLNLPTDLDMDWINKGYPMQ